MISAPTTIKVLEANTENVKDIIKDGFVSAVGHEATAQVITTKLNIPVQVNRINIKLVPGDVLIVFQLLSRLPEGKILSQDELRQMAAKWYVVTLQ